MGTPPPISLGTQLRKLNNCAILRLHFQSMVINSRSILLASLSIGSLSAVSHDTSSTSTNYAGQNNHMPSGAKVPSPAKHFRQACLNFVIEILEEAARLLLPASWHRFANWYDLISVLLLPNPIVSSWCLWYCALERYGVRALPMPSAVIAAETAILFEGHQR